MSLPDELSFENAKRKIEGVALAVACVGFVSSSFLWTLENQLLECAAATTAAGDHLLLHQDPCAEREASFRLAVGV
jgi:uncharacterized protein YfiM (DUF2279 family)